MQPSRSATGTLEPRWPATRSLIAAPEDRPDSRPWRFSLCERKEGNTRCLLSCFQVPRCFPAFSPAEGYANRGAIVRAIPTRLNAPELGVVFSKQRQSRPGKPRQYYVPLCPVNKLAACGRPAALRAWLGLAALGCCFRASDACAARLPAQLHNRRPWPTWTAAKALQAGTEASGHRSPRDRTARRCESSPDSNPARWRRHRPRPRTLVLL